MGLSRLWKVDRHPYACVHVEMMCFVHKTCVITEQTTQATEGYTPAVVAVDTTSVKMFFCTLFFLIENLSM